MQNLVLRKTLTHSRPLLRILRSLSVWNHVFLIRFRNVVKSFYTASLLYDVLTQFGELSQEVLITLGSLREHSILCIF